MDLGLAGKTSSLTDQVSTGPAIAPNGNSLDMDAVEEVLPPGPAPPAERGSVAGPLAISMLLWWLAFPPVGWWPLAWLVPIPLAVLVRRSRLGGRRPWMVVYFAGILYWMATFYFVPIPHPALWLGWLVLSLYLGLYLPGMLWAAHVLHHRWKWPLLIALPVAWTGSEWIRCHLLTGMGLVCLSHSQFRIPAIIQIADLCGAYTLTYAIATTGTACAIAWFGVVRSCRRQVALGTGVAVCVVAAVLLYGRVKTGSLPRTDTMAAGDSSAGDSIEIALIQGSIDTRLGEQEDVLAEKYRQYCELSWQARESWSAKGRRLDLIVWPEANLPFTDLLPDSESPDLPPNAATQARASMRAIWQEITAFPHVFGEPVWFVTGAGSSDFEQRYYNAGLLFNREGEIVDRYFKVHRVMYGEYFPVLDWFPSFRKQLPAIDAGTEPATFSIEGVQLVPLICFETTVPHLVRRHLNRLEDAGKSPDALLNLTNDGWFYGTACLDFHLACNVFRAVEVRRPNLVAANTGFSAWIDSAGRIVDVGPRRDVGVVPARIGQATGKSLYVVAGDLIPMLFAALALVAIGYDCLSRFSRRRKEQEREGFEFAVTRSAKG